MACQSDTPSCIQKNILAMARVIHTKMEIIRELPSLAHIRHMRTVLASTSKTLATLRLARAPEWKQFHTDETYRIQKSRVKAVVSILDTDGKLKTMCLSSSIVAKDGTT